MGAKRLEKDRTSLVLPCQTEFPSPTQNLPFRLNLVAICRLHLKTFAWILKSRFKVVVQRYAPNVMMTKLEKINVGKIQESVAAIMPVFEKSCSYIASHSQPPEIQASARRSTN